MRAYRLYNTEATDGRTGTTEGVAVSSTNTYYSTPISLARADGLSVQFAHTSTAAGALTMWCSNKDQPNMANDTDWVQVADALTDPAGSAGTTAEEIGNFRARWVRWKYVNASGSGTLKGWCSVNPGA